MLPPAERCLDSLRMWRSSNIVEGIKRSNNMCGSKRWRGGGGGGGSVAIFFKRGEVGRGPNTRGNILGAICMRNKQNLL